jgi:nicotinate-nucleotide adenylyltransferase
MNKIAIFGGSFDPVHLAHLNLADEIIKEFSIDKVVFVPAYAAPHKTKTVASSNDRIAMLSLALANNAKFSLNLFEAESLKPVYTYQTLDYFKTLYPSDKLYLLAGADSFNDFPNWKNIDYILNNCNVIIAKRPGVKIDKTSPYYSKVVFTSAQMPDISSTQIRNIVKTAPEKLSALTGKTIAAYITQHKLYE